MSSSLTASLAASTAVTDLCRELKLSDDEQVLAAKRGGKAAAAKSVFPGLRGGEGGDENEDPRFAAMGTAELQGVAEQELKIWGKGSL